MSEEAILILRKQFARWLKEDKWDALTVITNPELSEEEETDWYDNDKRPVEILSRISSDPKTLAEEIHQIRYDAGLSEAAEFMTEYRNSLVEAGLSATDIIEVLNFIDEQSEHSH